MVTRWVAGRVRDCRRRTESALMAGAIIRPITRKLRTERLGHDAIDADHAEISACWFQAVNCEPIQLPFLIARLKRMMTNHFTREDAIMRHAASSLCSCHRHEHEMLLGLCDRGAKFGESDWRAAQRLLRDEFPKRVHEHIICMDQMLVLHLNVSSASIPAAECQRGDYVR
jgi:hemerythrin